MPAWFVKDEILLFPKHSKCLFYLNAAGKLRHAFFILTGVSFDWNLSHQRKNGAGVAYSLATRFVRDWTMLHPRILLATNSSSQGTNNIFCFWIKNTFLDFQYAIPESYHCIDNFTISNHLVWIVENEL